MNLRFLFASGKNAKLPYYIRNYSKVILPKYLFQSRLASKLNSISSRPDAEYIISRVNYYNKLEAVQELPESSQRFSDLKKGGEVKSVYFLDAYRIISWFKGSYKWNYVPGDVIHIPDVPSIVKSRPIAGDNKNSVVLKLEKMRHFIFLKDNLKFNEKSNKLIFRGKVDNKPHRIEFMEKYFHHPLCDLGNITNNNITPPEWTVEKSTLYYHLKYKFILALEGNDVASNLKWIMSSNSIAVMPKPKFETWFMEGKLIANQHYIEIKEDYSDLEERLNYFIENPEEAHQIIKNANEYVSQFFNKEREHLIGLAVMNKYLEKTSQK
ncbi:glycosyltransferase family 90 protein [Salegentibacter sp. JZCK2]|uniref:glycosyltransferase family 90 protein n=1 Tax=Salegentibacter tibetensis TaxID=2873600 RepID=UPI001CCA6639|nr:glycosyltransferase family 90 protein [Salegentibacter tibetensis]MBZ9729461.1 glycosyltransferase family 90 protein [Salegentibacter tibetensis]